MMPTLKKNKIKNFCIHQIPKLFKLQVMIVQVVVTYHFMKLIIFAYWGSGELKGHSLSFSELCQIVHQNFSRRKVHFV